MRIGSTTDIVVSIPSTSDRKGNKRLGLAALLVTLGINGRRLTWSNDEAYDFIIDIVEGNLEDVTVIADRIVRGLEGSQRDG